MTSSSDTTPTLTDCPDCGVSPGEEHWDSCDVQRCSACKGQRLSCECDEDNDLHDPAASAWTGAWPGVAECRELGWWCIMGAKGWESCSADTPGATEDLNRYAVYEMTGVDPQQAKNDQAAVEQVAAEARVQGTTPADLSLGDE